MLVQWKLILPLWYPYVKYKGLSLSANINRSKATRVVRINLKLSLLLWSTRISASFSTISFLPGQNSCSSYFTPNERPNFTLNQSRQLARKHIANVYTYVNRRDLCTVMCRIMQKQEHVPDETYPFRCFADTDNQDEDACRPWGNIVGIAPTPLRTVRL